MTYQETVEYLYTQLPMFQRVGAAAFKKDLTKTWRLMEHLDNPHEKFNSIHVAGTNGKGSVTHMIAAGLQTSGYKTGIYCSPHLKDFRERIKIDGEWISQDFVIDFVEKMKPVIAEIKPSFFEITVAMAFQYFANQQVDVAVVEVGMGGRLDSTNVLSPELSVITNISYDHQQYLGGTLAEIAGEKAGIIKENTPVVIGRKQEETTKVFREIADDRNAPLIFVEDLVSGEIKQREFNKMAIELIELDTKKSKCINIGTGAAYQKENTLTSFICLNILKNKFDKIFDESINQGLSGFKEISNFAGRWHLIQETGPVILADCAHNSNALEQVFTQILSLEFAKLHCVIGTVTDKDLDKFFEVLPHSARFYFCKPDVPRGMDVQLLQQAARNKGFHGNSFDSVAIALKAAKQNAAEDDFIFVGGSIFVVAEVI